MIYWRLKVSLATERSRGSSTEVQAGQARGLGEREVWRRSTADEPFYICFTTSQKETGDHSFSLTVP